MFDFVPVLIASQCVLIWNRNFPPPPGISFFFCSGLFWLLRAEGSPFGLFLIYHCVLVKERKKKNKENLVWSFRVPFFFLKVSQRKSMTSLHWRSSVHLIVSIWNPVLCLESWLWTHSIPMVTCLQEDKILLEVINQIWKILLCLLWVFFFSLGALYSAPK